MIKHTQTILHDPTPGTPVGNCMQASVASLLGLPIESVPHFYEHPYEGLTESQQVDLRYYQEEGIDFWLAERGYCRLYLSYQHPRLRELVPLGENILVSGRSAREVMHVVIGRLRPDGWEMVHDVHPSRSGITSAEIVEWVSPIDSGVNRG